MGSFGPCVNPRLGVHQNKVIDLNEKLEKPAPDTPEGAAPGKTLSVEARRALEEAEARRAKKREEPGLPEEVDGRDGPEPTRYGDWERKGTASDF